MAMEDHFFSVILHLESVGPVENETVRAGFHGVMASTVDFESSDPSSNLGGTYSYRFITFVGLCPFYVVNVSTWKNWTVPT